MGDKYYGYETRISYSSESAYFKENPNVGGMATSDNRIVLNPYSKLNKKQLQSVAQNEAIRLWLRDNNVDPKFNVTPMQVESFRGTEYEKPENLLHLKHTLISRYLSGDPSSGELTEMQKEWAEWIRNQLPD